MASSFSNGLNSLGSAFNAVGSSIGGWFGDLQSAVGGWLGGIGQSVSDTFNSVSNGFQSVGNSFISVLDYLNPFSDHFILKVAFVPSQDFMSSYQNDWNSAMQEKFGFFYQMRDTMNALINSAQANVDSWEGVQISLPQYGIGSINIIDPQFANLAIPKLKFWIGGLMYFLTGMWVIRKVSNVLGAGKG